MIYIWLNMLPIFMATGIALVLAAAYRAVDRSAPAAVSVGMVAVAALGSFWFASILAGALILAPAKAAPWVMAVGTAVVIWAGFVLPVVAITQSYRRARVGGIVADAGYWLVTMVAMAVAMKLIGLVPPPAG